MMTPFDTNLMTHTAEKHRHPTQAERHARAEEKRRNRAAFWTFVDTVFGMVPRHGAVLPKAQLHVR